MAATRTLNSTFERSATRQLLPFVLIVFLGYLTIGIPLPVIPHYVNGTLGFSSMFVGCIIGCQSIATLLTRQFAGDITDKRGAKVAVLIGLFGCSLSSLSYAYSAYNINSSTSSLIILVLGRVLLGIGESLLITGSLSWCVGKLGKDHIGRSMVWVGIAMFGAIGIGAPFGSWLFNLGGLMKVAQISLLLPLLGMVIASVISGIPAYSGKRLSFYKVIGLIWKYGCGLALSTVGFGALFAFIGLDFESKGWQNSSYALTAFGAMYILVRLIFGGLPDRIGGSKVAVFTIPLQSIGLIALWLAPNPFIAFFGAAVLGGGYSLTFPSIGVEAIKPVPPQNRGAAMGAYVAFVDIGLGITGPAVGLIVANFGYPSAFLTGAMASFCALFIVFRLAFINHK